MRYGLPVLLLAVLLGCGAAQKVNVEPKSTTQPKTETSAAPKSEATDGGTANSTSNVNTQTETNTTQETNTETSQDSGPKGEEVAGDVVQHQFRPQREPGADTGNGCAVRSGGGDMAPGTGMVRPDSSTHGPDRSSDRIRDSPGDPRCGSIRGVRASQVKEVGMFAYRVTWFVIGLAVGPILWANRAAIIKGAKRLVSWIADQKTESK